MARYWQSTTIKGFFVEGRHQNRTIAEQLFEALDGGKISDEIMGAGFYIWLQKQSDPCLRIKDIGDRTVVELLIRDQPAKARKKPKPKKATEEPAEMESEAGEITGAPTEVDFIEETDDTEVIPQAPTALEEMFDKVNEALGALYTRVDETPSEYLTQLDLKLTKWERPIPMAIVKGGPMGEAGEYVAEAAGRRGGGIGALVAMFFAVVVLGGAVYYMLTHAANDPYYIFLPGKQFGREETAIGFVEALSGDLVVINIPDRHDTLWGVTPRFVREETDTLSATSLQVIEIDDLRVSRERMQSVILEPTGLEIQTTASELDISSLEWNRSEAWEDWFSSEINRAIVTGILVHQEDALWLQNGDNLIQVELWELLTDEQLLRLRWAESEGMDVRLEVRFLETFSYGSERTRASHKLFKAEIRLIISS